MNLNLYEDDQVICLLKDLWRPQGPWSEVCPRARHSRPSIAAPAHRLSLGLAPCTHPGRAPRLAPPCLSGSSPSLWLPGGPHSSFPISCFSLFSLKSLQTAPAAVGLPPTGAGRPQLVTLPLVHLPRSPVVTRFSQRRDNPPKAERSPSWQTRVGKILLSSLESTGMHKPINIQTVHLWH